MQVRTLTDIDRRWLLKAGSASMALLLPGCQSVVSAGPTVGASRSGERYLRAIRTRYGLPPLRPDPLLEKAALQQAGYMARSGRMTHNTGRGRDFAARMNAAGISGAGENLAFRVMTPDELFSLWMNSPGHRRNILNPRSSRFGLAYAGEAQSRYWALILR